MSRPQRWYQLRLARFFNEHYAEYEDDAEYYVDPAPNQWLFVIRDLSVIVELTCDDRGVISTEYRPLQD